MQVSLSVRSEDPVAGTRFLGEICNSLPDLSFFTTNYIGENTYEATIIGQFDINDLEKMRWRLERSGFEILT